MANGKSIAHPSWGFKIIDRHDHRESPSSIIPTVMLNCSNQRINQSIILVAGVTAIPIPKGNQKVWNILECLRCPSNPLVFLPQRALFNNFFPLNFFPFILFLFLKLPVDLLVANSPFFDNGCPNE